MSCLSEVRELLPLGAAGLLEPEEAARLKTHVTECEQCRRELEVLQIYSAALEALPTPALPAGLLARTQARLAAAHFAREQQRIQTWWLVALAAFSWTAGLAFWWTVRTATNGEWRVFGANLADALVWSAASTLLTWATAGAVTILLGRHREGMRNVL